MGIQVDGAAEAPVLVIIDAPTQRDAQSGVPLSCQDGQRFWRLAALGGITRSMCRVVCMAGEPAEKPIGRGRYVVSEKQILRGREIYVAALAASKARVAIILGGSALKYSTGLGGGIDAWRGYVEPPSTMPETVAVKVNATRYRAADKRCVCVTTTIEEYIGKKGGVHKRRIRHVDAECRVCRGAGVTARKGDVIVYKKAQIVRPPLAAIDTLQRFIATFDPGVMRMMGFALMPVMAADLKRAGRALRGELKMESVHFEVAPTIFPPGGIVAVDIETQYPDTSVLERVGVANETQVWTMPWNESSLNATRAVLAGASTVLIHNVGFDEPRLRAAGAPVPAETPIFCTMLGTYMVQPDGKKGLNYAISLFLDAERHKHLSGEFPAFYNAIDTRRTHSLHAPIVAELERTGQREWFERGVMPAARTLIRMSERGVRVDTAALARWSATLAERQAALRAWWDAESGGLNPASWQQVSRFFGTATSSEEALVAHLRATGDQRVKQFLELRKVTDDISDYASMALSPDGCVHPSFLPGQKDDDDTVSKGITYTGRWTSREPNLQKIPKPPSIARTMFIPHSPDNVLISVDWSQCELRVTAALSGDKVLAADLDAEDFFGVLEARLGAPRKVVKTGVYLSAYLGAPKTLHRKFQAEGVKISYSECVAFQAALFDRYRGWRAYRQAVIAEVEAKRELRLAGGKWAPFPGGARDASKAVNFPPQATNAMMATTVLPQLEVELARERAHLLLLVHDEFVVEAPRSTALHVARIVQNVMERRFDDVAPGFRVPTSAKIGESWGDMKEIEYAAV